MKQKFGVRYAFESPFAQLLLYVLNDKKYISHKYDLGECRLTDAGRLFHVLLKRSIGLDEPTFDQI